MPQWLRLSIPLTKLCVRAFALRFKLSKVINSDIFDLNANNGDSHISNLFLEVCRLPIEVGSPSGATERAQ